VGRGVGSFVGVRVAPSSNGLKVGGLVGTTGGSVANTGAKVGGLVGGGTVSPKVGGLVGTTTGVMVGVRVAPGRVGLCVVG